MNWLNQIKDKLFQAVDISSLAFFRIVFGLILCWEVTRYYSHDWIERYWIDPDYFFTFDGFHWIQPWEGNLMYVHFFFLGVLAVFITLGLFYRISSILFFLGFTYVFLLDQSNYLNHFYLISLLSFIMIFVDAHRQFSIDSVLYPQLKSDVIPAWMVWILRLQLGIVYFYGGIAKMNTDWLSGYPLRYWLAAKTDFPVIGSLFTEEWMVLLFAYSGLLLDLLITPFLIWKKTRPYAFAAITLFHLMNSELFLIGIFPWFMMFATTIFFEPDWFRKMISKLDRYQHFRKMEVKKLGSYFIKSKQLVFYGFCLYLIVQMTVPLRHFFMEGYVSWTEVGHKFSWHMKLRNKDARARFIVKDLDSGEEFKVNPKDLLSSRQRRKMSTRPDLILQFAHILDKEFEKRGHPNVAVYARITASLNGRKDQPLIRPEVDLLKITSKNSIYDWVTELTEELPVR